MSADTRQLQVEKSAWEGFFPFLSAEKEFQLNKYILRHDRKI